MNILIEFIIKFLLLLKLPFYLLRHNKISLTSQISTGVKLNSSIVGRHSYIGPGSILNHAIIGNYTSIAPYVQIGGMEHSFKWISTSTKLSDKALFGKKTIIGNDVWIGAGAIIRQGIEIGDGAVIGAGSFVNKDVPENVIVFGVPSKYYGNRFDDFVWSKIRDSKYWQFKPSKAKKITSNLEKFLPQL